MNIREGSVDLLESVKPIEDGVWIDLKIHAATPMIDNTTFDKCLFKFTMYHVSFT